MGRYCPALRRPLVAFRLTEALGRERSVALSHKTSRGHYSPERTVAFGFVVTVEWECHSNDDWCWTCCTNTINSSAMQKVHKWTCSAQFLNLVCLFFFFLVPFFFFFFFKFCFSGYQLTEISLSPHVNKHWCEASKCKALKEQTKQRLTLLVTHFVVFLCFEISFSCAVRDDFYVACQAKCHIFIVY